MNDEKVKIQAEVPRWVAEAMWAARAHGRAVKDVAGEILTRHYTRTSKAAARKAAARA
jgi:hypothetical protein